jgi:hypothetical protein
MVTVAVTGAVVAYRGAKAEQDTTVQMQRLAQGQVLELAIHQQAVTVRDIKLDLQSRMDALLRAGGELMQETDTARNSAAHLTGAWRQMRAQEEFVAARAYQPFLEVLPSYGEDYPPPRSEPNAQPLTPEERVQAIAASNLAGRGYETFWHDPRYPKPRYACAPAPEGDAQASSSVSQSIWCRLDNRIELSHGRERELSLALVVLVLALTCFTAADVWRESRRRWLVWTLFALGLALAAVELVAVCREIDPGARSWVLTAAILTPLVLVLALIGWARLRGWTRSTSVAGHSHPEHFYMEKGSIPAPSLTHAEEGGFGRFTVLIVASALIISAGCGWGYTVADTRASAAADEARFHATEVYTHSEALGLKMFEFAPIFASIAEARARLAVIRQRLAEFHRPEDEARATLLKTQHHPDLERWLDDHRYGDTENDLSFPRRLLFQFQAIEGDRAEQNNPWEPYARWWVSSQQSLAWRQASGVFLVTLTLLAIGLYLLGQALAMGVGRNGYVLQFSGILFVIAGLVMGYSAYSDCRAVVRQLAPQTTNSSSQRAAACIADIGTEYMPDFDPKKVDPYRVALRAYAVGKVMHEEASDRLDDVEAVTALRCAIDLHADLPDARRVLAAAIPAARSSNWGEASLRLPGKNFLATRVQLEEEAVRGLCEEASPSSADADDCHDIRSGKGEVFGAPGLLSDLAFDHLLLGFVQKTDDADWRGKSVTRAETAVRLAEATGQAIEAHDMAGYNFTLGLTYLVAGDLRAASAAYEQGLEAPPEWTRQLRASAMTDLETFSASGCGPSRPGESSRQQDAAALCAREREMIEEIKSRLAFPGASEGHGPKPQQILSQDDFNIQVTAGHLTANLRGVDPLVHRLWLTWYQLEPTWNSWQALQRLSGPIEAKALDNGWLREVRSAVRQYQSRQVTCLEGSGLLFDSMLPATERLYRAELYSDGVLIGLQDARNDKPSLRLQRIPDLNVSLCRPWNWIMKTENAVVGSQSASYGHIRQFVASVGQAPAAFVVTQYMPCDSIARHPCLGADAIARRAIKTLTDDHLVNGREPLVSFESLGGPNSTLPQTALVYRAWQSNEGEGHVVIVLAKTLPPEQIWQVLESAEVSYDETGSVCDSPVVPSAKFPCSRPPI